MYQNTVGKIKGENITPSTENAIDLLIDYLTLPNAEEIFKTQAYAYALSLLDREPLGNLVTRASEIWRDTAFFSGCVHDTNTACLSAMQLLLLFLDFLVLLRTVPSVFRIRKNISAGY